MSSIFDHAERELKNMALDRDNPELYDSILQVIKAVWGSKIQQLLKYRPITLLTGEDEEWFEYGDDKYQNKRYPSVFKDSKRGQAYDMNAKIFIYPDGVRVVRGGLNVSLHIEFPYAPAEHPEEVEVDDRGDVI